MQMSWNAVLQFLACLLVGSCAHVLASICLGLSCQLCRAAGFKAVSCANGLLVTSACQDLFGSKTVYSSDSVTLCCDVLLQQLGFRCSAGGFVVGRRQ
eukprot:4186192-Amphidinium_carterae.2